MYRRMCPHLLCSFSQSLVLGPHYMLDHFPKMGKELSVPYRKSPIGPNTALVHSIRLKSLFLFVIFPYLSVFFSAPQLHSVMLGLRRVCRTNHVFLTGRLEAKSPLTTWQEWGPWLLFRGRSKWQLLQRKARLCPGCRNHPKRHLPPPEQLWAA